MSSFFLVWPAVYAVVGAASFCGGITHTISTAVVAYELTGQLVYILPVMVPYNLNILTYFLDCRSNCKRRLFLPTAKYLRFTD